MPLWGKFRVSFDSWRLMNLDNHLIEESDEIGDVNVETDNWRPIDGRPVDRIRVGFIDGVRRTENMVYIEDPDEMLVVEGAFVSVGAGAITLEFGRLNSLEESFKRAIVKRYFLLRENLRSAQPRLRFITKAGTIEFEVKHAKKELSPYVNDLMASLEAFVAEKVYKDREAEILITDGTLHFNVKRKGLPFIGYVKKHKRIYLYPEHYEVLRKLKVGQRTPLVLIHSQPTTEENGKTDKFDKFTWYIKLNDGEGINSVARLEVPAEIGIERAIELADISAYLVPKFASVEFNDKRAPQNLIPIRYLENYLRRHLGSQSLIRKLIAEKMIKH